MEGEETKLTFEAYWEITRQDINKTIDRIFSEEETLFQPLRFAIRGGKRFRPTLTVLVAEALGGKRKEALEYGAVIEFIHGATLVHDDVYDGDEERRGKESVWKLYGIKSALVIGDGLLAKAYSLIKNEEAAKCVGKGLWCLFKGFMMEATHPKETLNYIKYLDIVMLKTAALYATACQLGAISAKEEYLKKNFKSKILPPYERIFERARQYGKCLGIAYQLADDLSEGELPPFLSEERATQDIIMWCERAKKHARKFPPSKYRELMLEVPEFMVQKIMEEQKG